ncbi:MAG TPA: ABC transporter substrate-binding protein [Nitratidesulfovibrio sp.]|nr:ABC transporter substrate-binding protein [Nitratidesulfovibrio sp.]
MKRLVLLAVALCVVLSGTIAHAGKIEDIKARGALVCGVKDSTVPFGFIDEQTKQIVGFDVDICKAVADKLGVNLELKTVTSATRIPMLTQGSVDMLAATMTHKFERDDVIDFSITYFMDGQKLLVKKGGGVKSAADLKGKKVATAKGSTSEKNIKAAQPGATVVSFDEYPQAFLALKQGKAEAVTTDSTILLGLRNSDPEPEKWEIVGDYIAAEPYGLGVAENDSKFRDLVNRTLVDLWNTGEYVKIYDKWFGKDTKYYLPLTWKMETWPY